jgi:hypothetical protein
MVDRHSSVNSLIFQTMEGGDGSKMKTHGKVMSMKKHLTSVTLNGIVFFLRNSV